MSTMRRCNSCAIVSPKGERSMPQKGQTRMYRNQSNCKRFTRGALGFLVSTIAHATNLTVFGRVGVAVSLLMALALVLPFIPVMAQNGGTTKNGTNSAPAGVVLPGFLFEPEVPLNS